MAQTTYDEPEFFRAYESLERSHRGLERAWEWPAMRSLLPDFRNARVLDIGCGFGALCRYARQQGAQSVLGVDASQKMLARAATLTGDPAIVFRHAGIEEEQFEAGAFDVAVSSLTLHYVERFDLVAAKVFACLAPGGAFAISVEHPICTAIGDHIVFRMHTGGMHWPLRDYMSEGARNTEWLGGRHIKYHRTVATYVNTLLDAGFSLQRLLEPKPEAARIAENSSLSLDLMRPMFLLLSAIKPRA